MTDERAEDAATIPPHCRMTAADWCDRCGRAAAVVDEFEDSIGFEEQERPVHVIALDCGHDIWWETRR